MYKFVKKFFNSLRPPRSLFVANDSGGKNKPVIILLHGIAATSKTWQPMIGQLDTEKYRVIALDVLGFGGSPMPTNCDYTVDDHVKYVHRTLRRMRIKSPYILMGHSMGSIIAAHYCQKFPKLVKRAYLLSLPLYPENIENRKNIPAKLTDFYIKAYNLMCEKKAFTIKYSQYLRKILRVDDGIDVNDKTWNSFKLSLKNTIINQNTYRELSSIKVPIHVFYGSLDQFLVQDNMKLLSAFDNVQTTKLRGVDHSVGLRFSKVVAAQIAADSSIIAK